jgi:hypothetical protein
MMRRCREYDIAFGLLEEGIRAIETTGERMCEADLYRLLGELELEVGGASQVGGTDNRHCGRAPAACAALGVPPLPWRRILPVPARSS